MVNECWVDFFPNSTVEFIGPGESDHSPSLLKLDMGATKLHGPFKVFNHVGFMEAVRDSWQVHRVTLCRSCIGNLKGSNLC